MCLPITWNSDNATPILKSIWYDFKVRISQLNCVFMIFNIHSIFFADDTKKVAKCHLLILKDHHIDWMIFLILSCIRLLNAYFNKLVAISSLVNWIGRQFIKYSLFLFKFLSKLKILMQQKKNTHRFLSTPLLDFSEIRVITSPIASFVVMQSI